MQFFSQIYCYLLITYLYRTGKNTRKLSQKILNTETNYKWSFEVEGTENKY